MMLCRSVAAAVELTTATRECSYRAKHTISVDESSCAVIPVYPVMSAETVCRMRS